ncbi:conserved Plasmodium protein, unknown function [Plasmodium ovale]|uniref:Uncharacterized protein n=1 Tax=Plasmodium ovale TaxID=36330 RepID=A0A1D3TL21_PLAOA|nr:conserved Plasmodium protein, unknown function [Plasmodium ovale]
MHKSKVFFLLSLLMLICEITGIKISRKTEAAPEKTIFTQTTSSSPTLFNLFSAKAGPQPTVNFFLEENRNLWLYRRVNNEENRNRRRAFADFQELRQNDLLRFHELMITQNEQISMLKKAMSSVR